MPVPNLQPAVEATLNDIKSALAEIKISSDNAASAPAQALAVANQKVINAKGDESLQAAYTRVNRELDIALHNKAVSARPHYIEKEELDEIAYGYKNFVTPIFEDHFANITALHDHIDKLLDQIADPEFNRSVAPAIQEQAKKQLIEALDAYHTETQKYKAALDEYLKTSDSFDKKDANLATKFVNFVSGSTPQVGTTLTGRLSSDPRVNRLASDYLQLVEGKALPPTSFSFWNPKTWSNYTLKKDDYHDTTDAILKARKDQDEDFVQNYLNGITLTCSKGGNTLRSGPISGPFAGPVVDTIGNFIGGAIEHGLATTGTEKNAQGQEIDTCTIHITSLPTNQADRNKAVAYLQAYQARHEADTGIKLIFEVTVTTPSPFGGPTKTTTTDLEQAYDKTANSKTRFMRLSENQVNNEIKEYKQEADNTLNALSSDERRSKIYGSNAPGKAKASEGAGMSSDTTPSLSPRRK